MMLHFVSNHPPQPHHVYITPYLSISYHSKVVGELIKEFVGFEETVTL